MISTLHRGSLILALMAFAGCEDQRGQSQNTAPTQNGAQETANMPDTDPPAPSETDSADSQSDGPQTETSQDETTEGIVITADQKRRIKSISSILETGRASGRYDAISPTSRAPNMYYGRMQASLRAGNIYKIVKAYVVTPGALYADEFQPYLTRLENKDESLATDEAFRALLAKAGQDPVMAGVQEAYIDTNLLGYAITKANENGIKTALGLAMFYDGRIKGPGYLVNGIKLINEREGTVDVIGEKVWLRKYAEERQERMKTFMALMDKDNWDLDPPIEVIRKSGAIVVIED